MFPEKKKSRLQSQQNWRKLFNLYKTFPLQPSVSDYAGCMADWTYLEKKEVIFILIASYLAVFPHFLPFSIFSDTGTFWANRGYPSEKAECTFKLLKCMYGRSSMHQYGTNNNLVGFLEYKILYRFSLELQFHSKKLNFMLR